MTTRHPTVHRARSKDLGVEIYRVVLEREGRVSPPPGFVLPDLATAFPSLVPEAGKRSRHSAYFDTADLALADAGITVRRDDVAGRFEWRLVVTPDSTAAFPIRRRLHFAGNSETVPRELLAYLTRHHDRRNLAAVTTVDGSADVVTLFSPFGVGLAEVVDECVRVSGTSASTVPKRQIAVTTRVLNPVGADLLHAVVTYLEQAGCRLELPTGDAYRFTAR